MIALLENTTKLSNNQPVPVAMQASTNQMKVHTSIVQTALRESMEIFPVPMPNPIVKIVQLGGMAQNLVKPARAIAANAREGHGVALLGQALIPRAQNV
jgi:hypothetical protein